MLGKQLLKNGLIDKDQLRIAVTEQQKSGRRLGRLLVEFGFLSEIQLRDTLGKMSGIRSIDLSSTQLDPDALKLLSAETAKRFRAVPFRLDKETQSLTLAMSEANNLVALDRIRRSVGKHMKIKVIQASDSDIDRSLELGYGSKENFDNLLQRLDVESQSDQEESHSDGPSNALIRLVDFVLEDAVRAGASDIHLEPEAGFVRIRYRADGVLFQIRSLHKKHWLAIVSRLKVMAQMDIAENRLPQDGSFSLTLDAKQIDFRVSSFPILHGENIVLRILDRNKSILSLPDLGLDMQQLDLIRNILDAPEGLVLIAGPTGSGKTTTLYSLINEINNTSVNIMTLEDPVEYPLNGVRQSNLGQHRVLNYQDGIRAILRQDPDIVLIGEIRDADTAAIAVRAALTGHKVYSTIHTRSSFSAVQRLVDLGVKQTMLSGNLLAVISQRLVRMQCNHCASRAEGKKTVCPVCGNSGYKGQRAVIEILNIDDTLNRMILDCTATDRIESYARNLGWVPLRDKARELVHLGISNESEIKRVFGIKADTGQ